MDQALDELIADFEARPLPKTTPRRATLPHVEGKVDAVIGMRRSGKTYLLYQAMQRLEREGVGSDRRLYLNFEDDRLGSVSADDLQRIPEAFFRRHPVSRAKESWFFFDEVHAVDGWERFVRRLVDTENVRIVVTGSSAKMLSREIATTLRGRAIATEVFPFSFAEALDHAGVAIPARWPAAAQARSRLANAFDRYLEVGGFPEVQTVAQDLRVRILQDYIDVVVLRDVAERHSITNLVALRALVRRLLRSPASLFSVNRLHEDLKSQGIAVGKDAVHEYIAHFEDAYLAFMVPRRTESERQRQVNPKKAYLVDHGLANAARLRPHGDVGHVLENVVFVELRRRGLDVAYYVTASGFEVDFACRTPTGEESLVQSCADLGDPETRSRELRSLEEAMAELDVREATIVTRLQRERIELASGVVHVVPAWEWCLRAPNSR